MYIITGTFLTMRGRMLGKKRFNVLQDCRRRDVCTLLMYENSKQYCLAGSKFILQQDNKPKHTVNSHKEQEVLEMTA